MSNQPNNPEEKQPTKPVFHRGRCGARTKGVCQLKKKLEKKDLPFVRMDFGTFVYVFKHYKCDMCNESGYAGEVIQNG